MVDVSAQPKEKVIKLASISPYQADRGLWPRRYAHPENFNMFKELETKILHSNPNLILSSQHIFLFSIS